MSDGPIIPLDELTPRAIMERKVAVLREQLRRKIRRSFLTWCKYALAPLGETPARHHLLLISALEEVARGQCPRLMVFMPPGAAKSTYSTVLFPVSYTHLTLPTTERV